MGRILCLGVVLCCVFICSVSENCAFLLCVQMLCCVCCVHCRVPGWYCVSRHRLVFVGCVSGCCGPRVRLCASVFVCVVSRCELGVHVRRGRPLRPCDTWLAHPRPHVCTPARLGTPERTGVHLSPPQGAFSRCYKLTDMATSAVFALKVVPRIGGGAGRLRCKGKVEREIALHSSLRHRNIVAFHGHFADRDHVYMVLEYCGRQSLAHVLKARQTLTEPEVRYYLRGVVSGLRYLHQRRIVHRDLKLSNFFLNNNMEVKIGDLGLAARVGPGGRCHRVLCGTPNFLAPEVVSRNGHTCQSDIWALGCILYTVLTGSPPFPVAPVSEMYENIRAGRYPEPAHLSPNARHLIARLLAPNPAERPSLDQLLQDNFFTQGFTPERLPPRSCRSPPNFAVPRPLGSLFRKVGRLLLAECRPHRPFTPKEDLGSGAEGLEPYPMEWGSEVCAGRALKTEGHSPFHLQPRLLPARPWEARDVHPEGAAFSGTQALLVLNRAGKDLLLSLWRPGWPGAPCSLHTLRMLGCSPVARQRLRLALRLPRGILGWGSAAFPCVQVRTPMSHSTRGRPRVKEAEDPDAPRHSQAEAGSLFNHFLGSKAERGAPCPRIKA
ncbi:inactive serine/threonine-protein kinase PLK5 [Fukomys damarensis]|uniref:inactive serine/threonine-protein kinase PLK5 n=1 Tax=Fukomys damarensis TaxID=885580 RepID=UPI0014553AAD|nr:inactive serine/threonine-protein kinase PLK5 [Fukomys damarensis]